jgi:hypothetical protein
VAQTVTVTPLVDADMRDESVSVTLTAPIIMLPTTVSVSVSDPDVQSLVVSPGSQAVTEEGAPTAFDVSLAFEPDADVVVFIASDDPGAVAVSDSSLTFPAADYDTPRSFQVSGVSDPDLADEIGVLVDLTSADAPAAQVAVDVFDDDDQDIFVSKTAVAVVEEGAVDTFTVALAFEPASTETINIGNDNPTKIGATPAPLSFAPGLFDVPQTVTVRGLADLDLADETGTLTVRDAAMALLAKTVDVSVSDDDSQTLVIGVAESATGDLSVSLAFRPNADVTVAFDSDDPTRIGLTAVAPLPALPLVFTPANWDTPQGVRITVAEDADAAGETRTVTAAPSVLPADDPFGAVDVTVNITDNDAQAIVINQASVDIIEPLSGVESDSTTTARLQFDPVTPVVVTVFSMDATRVAVTPTTLTFNGSCTGAGCWDTPQAVTIDVVPDIDLTDDAVVVVLSAGAMASVLTVNISDIGQQALVVAPAALTLDEESSQDIEVTLAFAPPNPITVDVVSVSSAVADVRRTGTTVPRTRSP